MAEFTLFLPGDESCSGEGKRSWVDGVYRECTDSQPPALIRISVCPDQRVYFATEFSLRGDPRYKTSLNAHVEILSGVYTPSIVPFRNVFSNHSLFLTCYLESQYGDAPSSKMIFDNAVIEVRWLDDAWESVLRE